jgi:hypothetical protein
MQYMGGRYERWTNSEPIILSSSHDLRVFAAQIHPFGMDVPRQVELQIPSMSTARQQIWHKRIRKRLQACGCPAGAACTLLALAYCIAAQFNLVGGLESNGWRGILIAAGIVISAGFLGKMGALFLSRMLLKRDVKRLILIVEEESRAV